MNVNIDDELYEKVRNLTKKNKRDYPTIQYFVNKAIEQKLEKVQKNEK